MFGKTNPKNNMAERDLAVMSELFESPLVVSSCGNCGLHASSLHILISNNVTVSFLKLAISFLKKLVLNKVHLSSYCPAARLQGVLLPD